MLSSLASIFNLTSGKAGLDDLQASFCLSGEPNWASSVSNREAFRIFSAAMALDGGQMQESAKFHQIRVLKEEFL